MDEILHRIREAFNKGKIVFSKHARDRALGRVISNGDIYNAVANGEIVEVRRNEEFGVDDYAIEGPGLDPQHRIRVVVSFVDIKGERVIIITLINI